MRIIKQAEAAAEVATNDDKVRRTVEEILNAIMTRGDEAVREYSAKFDKWKPTTFRLTEREIAACYDRVPASIQADIRFAQEQIRNFATAQRESMLDVEVETLPGIVLG